VAEGSGLLNRRLTKVGPWVRIPPSPPINSGMKDLLKILPQILSMMPGIVQYIKYIPILLILAGAGYGAYYYFLNYKDPYVCIENQLFEQARIDSNVYLFKGDICVSNK
jgi:hypothetical protein